MAAVTEELIRTLLHQSESETLDFKCTEYPRGNDQEKGELIKDIVSMANAWRTGQAYILVGVQESPGPKAIVVGVANHPDDADIQQLVNSKLNRPVRFRYCALAVDGKQIGVFEIDNDPGRPFFLKKNLGALLHGVVYIRRGSSTDVAGPDEIADMGSHRAKDQVEAPVIDMQFADLERHKKLGNAVKAYSTRLFVPSSPMACYFAGIKPVEVGRYDVDPNEFRKWAQSRAVFASIGFCFTNRSQTVAHDVNATIQIPHLDDLMLTDEFQIPKRPVPRFRGPKLPVVDADVRVTDTQEFWSINLDVGKLKPREERWLENSLYIGVGSPMEVEAKAVIFGDNLPNPATTLLKIAMEIRDARYDPSDWDE